MKTIKRTFTTTLALVLALLMAVYLFPADVAAAAHAGNDPESQTNEQTEEKAVDALFELTDLRTADTKYIKMSDGTIQALVYETAVHAQDENGVWQDINNCLTVGNNTVDSARVKFQKQITGNGELFTLHDGNKKVTLSFADAIKKTPVTVVNDGTTDEKYATKLEELSTLSKVVSSVRYNGILPNTDVEYILSGNDLKENIVINALQDYYTYSFELALNNLTAVLSEDGSVLLSEGEDTVYIIPAPYMYDAACEFSKAVSYTLSEANGNGKYILTVTADAEWINDENRVFPVTIDPTIQKNDTRGVIDTYVTSLRPNVDYNNSVNSNNVALKCGYDSALGAVRSIIRMQDLPAIPAGSVITKATLDLYLYDYYSGHPDIPLRLEAHQITSSWQQYGTTWNTKPTTDGRVLDYHEFTSDDVGEHIQFDITRVAKSWYDGVTNYGIQLNADIEYPNTGYLNALTRFYASDYTVSGQESKKPVFSISYISGVGVRSDLTYRKLDAGEAGSIYLCDYNQQLTLIKELSSEYYTGTVFVPSLVYNSFSDKKWNYSWETTISSTTVNSVTVYTYIDANGTEYYFTEENGEITAAVGNDGDYTLTKPSSLIGSIFAIYNLTAANCLILTDPVGIQTLFYNNKPLLVGYDETTEIVELRYAASGDWKPSDSSSHVCCIYMNKENTSTKAVDIVDDSPVAKIKFYEGASIKDSYWITYSYDLPSVIRYFAEDSSYYDCAEYSYSYGILTRAEDMKNEVKYLFDTNSNGGRSHYASFDYYVKCTISTNPEVRDYLLFNSASISFVENSYTTYHYTTSTDPSSGFYTSYVFGASGDTINEYTYDKTGKVYSASMSETLYEVLQNGTQNKDVFAETEMQSTNLLRTSGFETSSFNCGWSFTVPLTFSTTVKRSGNRSLFMGAVQNESLESSQQVTLEANTDYCFSAYVYIDENAIIDEADGVYLKVYKNSVKFAESYHLSLERNTWQRIVLPFLSSSAGQYSVSIGFDNVNGYVYVDDVQLEKGASPSDYNYISNAYTTGSTGIWTATNGSTFSCATVAFPENDNNNSNHTTSTLKISGGIRNVGTISTIIPIYNDNTYILSGFGKASSVYILEKDYESGDRSFALIAEAHYSDNTCQTFVGSFNPYAETWQYTSIVILPKENETIESITVKASYDFNYGDAYFTGLSLTQGTAYVYTEDDSIGTEQNGPTEPENGTVTTYNASGICQLLGLDSGCAVYFPSGATMTVEDITDESNDVTGKIVYDEEKNCVATVVYGGTKKKITASYKEETIDGYRIKSVDEYGNVSYENYSNDNRLLSRTDACGVITTYSYGNTETSGTYDEVCCSNSWIRYHYDSTGTLINVTADSLTSTRPDNYVFTYNDLNQLTTVSIEGIDLVTNEYDVYGKLLSMTYANSFEESYTYDHLDRVKEISYNGIVKYKYIYIGNSENVYRIDEVNSSGSIINSVEYIYTDGVVTRELHFDGEEISKAIYHTYNDGVNLGSRLYFYDNASSQWIVNSAAKIYNDDSVLTGEDYSDSTVTYAYDDFDRLTSSTAGTLGFVKSFEYANESSNRTGNLVDSVSYAKNNTLFREYTYTYDACGRITSIQKNQTDQASYEYDAFGQLIRENNVAADKTYVYEYDGQGNIKYRYTYAYRKTTPTSNLTSPTQTDSYTYATTNDGLWGDVLKYYNGVELCYDDSGNPTTYANGQTYSLSWSNGRQLISGSVGNKSFSYTYDSDGLRTSKTVNGTTYKYYWNDNRQLSAMTWINGYVLIHYDCQDLPYSITVKDSDGVQVYYYITNLQGDVIGLASAATGNWAVTYEYDAWGKLISKQAYSSGYAGAYQYNPLTYRGYIYDEETGFYYLQTRYYDPTVGRFINGDNLWYLGVSGTLLSLSLFAYCENNPISNVDPYGLLVWPGEIHNYVQTLLSLYILFTYDCFVYIDYFIRFGFLNYGFADLYAKHWNEIWEVKPNKDRYRKSGHDQLKKYIKGISGSKEGRNLGTFEAYYFSRGFFYKIDIYSISSDGMIYYDYEISWKVTGKMLAALGAIVLIATGFGAAAGESVLQGVLVW